MALESSTIPNRFAESPLDKPQLDRVEFHANLERPGAQFHPRATSAWKHAPHGFPAWPTR